MSFHFPVLASRDKKRPVGFKALISDTMLLAINRFSRLNRAVKYTRLRFSTSNRKRSFPGWELMDPPRPHKTSFSLGSLTQSLSNPESFSSGVTKEIERSSPLSLVLSNLSIATGVSGAIGSRKSHSCFSTKAKRTRAAQPGK